MANAEHLAILQDALAKNDISIWNQWCNNFSNVKPDLSKAFLAHQNLSSANLKSANLSWADLSKAKLMAASLQWATLSKANLRGADLSKAQLTEANLNGAILHGANLSRATLIGANLRGADLQEANLDQANLSFADVRGGNLSRAFMQSAYLYDTNLSYTSLIGANLWRANLYQTSLWGANLYGADLTEAMLTYTRLDYATLEGCIVGGIAARNFTLLETIQKDLNISPRITMDNLNIAQFLYLLLNNAEIRNVIDTITAKAVLILGCFAPERKVILDTIRENLRQRGFLPITFDFDKPSSGFWPIDFDKLSSGFWPIDFDKLSSRDLTETVRTLAHLSRFVIADLTEPSSIPHEGMSFIEGLPSVPVQPIILKEHRPYAMFLDHLGRYQHVLDVYEYESQETLIAEIAEKVIQPAQDKAEAMKPKPF